jgi:L-lactate permease
MLTQIVDPLGSLLLTCLVALIPVVLLLVLLAVFRVSAWLAVLIGSLVTFLLAAVVWKMPLDDGLRAYIYGSATGVWNVDWITVWGVMLFNTLTITGVFESFRRWLISQGTLDVRVQTMLFAWAFGKPIAPQTASVGVSTSKFVRNEGEVIRHNMGWTLILLAYLIVIGVGFYWFKPAVIALH